MLRVLYSMVRLQKHIADLGITSRRKAEDLIRFGKVQVNGRIVVDLATQIDPEHDTVDVDLPKAAVEEQTTQERYAYIALNKPVDYDAGSIHALLTEEQRTGKMKLGVPADLRPATHLDAQAEGLLLLSNDPELLINKIEYQVTIDTPLSKGAVAILQKGMLVGTTFFDGLDISYISNRGKRSVISIFLHSRPHTDITAMFQELGYRIIAIRCIRIGKLSIGTLTIGKWKFVRKKEIA